MREYDSHERDFLESDIGYIFPGVKTLE